jgi:hypothetical protein
MWEYWLVDAQYRAFPRWDGYKWRMRGDGQHEHEEFIKAEEAAKIRLWADGKWRELGLDPDVDWRARGEARLIWDPWAECARLEADALNSFGQRGWEVVAVYPNAMPVGSNAWWWARPDMVYVLKRPLPHAPDEIELGQELPPQL